MASDGRTPICRGISGSYASHSSVAAVVGEGVKSHGHRPKTDELVAAHKLASVPFAARSIIRYIRPWNIRYIGLSNFFSRRRGGSLSRSRGAILVQKSKFSCKSQIFGAKPPMAGIQERPSHRLRTEGGSASVPG